ncbi:uncharacterized protein LOC120144739 [Hibiscus syriacus]|uniref:uncharacterized protein LOC120144739 n=1 Tax=Hibiscus syriacus TaxID=106335 RepID=UPI0019229AEB|nr:uncharacterized protein LOC120144739 [Hibiscus syriacus]
MRNKKLDIVALLEPKVSGSKAEKFNQKSGFGHSFRIEANEFSGGIWILWNDTISMDFLVASNQYVHGYCIDKLISTSFFVSFVYASPNGSMRNLVWNQIRALAPNENSPWLLGGDFNAICKSVERKGGSHSRTGICLNFGEFIFEAGLLYIGFNGPQYTWLRGNLSQRLDRCLCNNRWYSAFPASEVLRLQKMGPDHRLILMSIEVPENNPLFNSLINLQSKCCNWNNEVFGHIGRRKTLLLARIRGVEIALERSESTYLLDLYEALKNEINVVLEQEESLWHQSLEVSGLRKEIATQYFHATTINRRRQNSIRMLQMEDGRWCDDHEVL